MDKCLTGMCFFADLNYLKSENQYQTKTGTYFYQFAWLPTIV